MSKQEDARDAVLDLIESLSVGQAIPSERQLTQELGVSRLTVRAALDGLVRDGYLDRRHGSGTYITEPKIAQPLTLTSFSDEMRRRGRIGRAQQRRLRACNSLFPLRTRTAATGCRDLFACLVRLRCCPSTWRD